MAEGKEQWPGSQGKGVLAVVLPLATCRMASNPFPTLGLSLHL